MPLEFELDGRKFQPHRVFCIGRNYSEHVRELANEAPRSPVVFMKPAACLVPEGEILRRPPYGAELHHEAEVVLLIGGETADVEESRALDCVAGVTLGLDLTLRDVQRDLTRAGLPWELSKAFDQSAPVGRMVPRNRLDPERLTFRCRVNGEVRQRGDTRQMIFPVPALIRFLSRHWTLRPGDLVYTGTPAGVGPLASGDRIVIESEPIGSFSWTLE